MKGVKPLLLYEQIQKASTPKYKYNIERQSLSSQEPSFSMIVTHSYIHNCDTCPEAKSLVRADLLFLRVLANPFEFKKQRSRGRQSRLRAE